MLENAIYEFGKRLSMDGLALNEQGLVVIDIDNLGRLHLEKDENKDILYIYLSLPYPPYNDTVPKNILDICSYHHNHPFTIKGGVYDNWATLIAEFDSNNIDASTIENVVRYLAARLEVVFS